MGSSGVFLSTVQESPSQRAFVLIFPEARRGAVSLSVSRITGCLGPSRTLTNLGAVTAGKLGDP